LRISELQQKTSAIAFAHDVPTVLENRGELKELGEATRKYLDETGAERLSSKLKKLPFETWDANTNIINIHPDGEIRIIGIGFSV
jgi:hypothetical protein